jgi:DNA-directed RNA polymerase subunit omega
MARITVEDCESKVGSNRFELVLEAVERVRQILTGSPIMVEARRDKNPVIALREIAAGKVSSENLHEAIVKNLQTHTHMDEEEQDVLAALAEETAWFNTVQESASVNIEEELVEDGLVITDDPESI